MKFTQERTPRLEFGSGAILTLPEMALRCAGGHGNGPSELALVLGGASFRSHRRYGELCSALRAAGIRLREFSCPGEPSPDFVDAAVGDLLKDWGAEPVREGRVAVAGIGGGSVLDAGKALAAMLAVAADPEAGGERPSVQEFLEGVGSRAPTGRSVPCIACPTTAGTGSEATKNAVLSRVGPGGFKKSLRHEGFIPSAAIIDPELAVPCPRAVTAAGGLDALTQLLEAWTSPLASPLVAALCRSGVEEFSRSFAAVLADGGDIKARSGMAYGAYLSGVALANAGLGAVHGLASPVGARYPIPHGLVCGTLLAPVCELNIRRLSELRARAGTDEAGDADSAFAAALSAYAQAGYLLAGRDAPACRKEREQDEGCDLLLGAVAELTELARLPSWREYGFDREDIPDLARAAAAKTNPVLLGPSDYEDLLRSAMRR